MQVVVLSCTTCAKVLGILLPGELNIEKIMMPSMGVVSWDYLKEQDRKVPLSGGYCRLERRLGWDTTKDASCTLQYAK